MKGAGRASAFVNWVLCRRQNARQRQKKVFWCFFLKMNVALPCLATM
jgi:hypothetical protein